MISIVYHTTESAFPVLARKRPTFKSSNEIYYCWNRLTKFVPFYSLFSLTDAFEHELENGQTEWLDWTRRNGTRRKGRRMRRLERILLETNCPRTLRMKGIGRSLSKTENCQKIWQAGHQQTEVENKGNRSEDDRMKSNNIQVYFGNELLTNVRNGRN